MVVGLTVNVGTTAVNLNTALGLGRGDYHLVFRGANYVSIGDSAVTFTGGFPLPTNASDYFHMDLRAGDEIYAISSTSTQVYVLAYEV